MPIFSQTMSAGAVALLFATHVSAQTPPDPDAMSNVTQSHQYEEMAADPQGQAPGVVEPPQNPNQPRTAHTAQKTGHAGKTNHHASIKTNRQENIKNFAPGTVDPGTPNK